VNKRKQRSLARVAEAYILKNVNKRKQRSLARVAEAYILKNDLDVETRFDIVSVIVTPMEKHLHHIEDAFYPTM